MRIELSDDQRQRLIKALGTSYDPLTADAMLIGQLGRQLVEAVPANHAWDTAPAMLQQKAYKQSWNAELILAAAAGAPHDAELAGLVLQLGLSAAGPGRLSVSPSVRSKDATLASLEGLVNKASALQDVAAFIATLTRLQHQVCRIETQATPPAAVGTGFLVGEDLVLTNWHVAESLRSSSKPAGCRFDYRADVEGVEVSKGFVVPLGGNWLLEHQPYAESDVKEGGRLPTDGELDFALLRISAPVARYAPGNTAATPGGGGRGFMRLADAGDLPAVDDELFVLQHPSGQPLKLAVGQVLERVVDPAAPLRLRHDSTTEGGSSGSPCFDASLRLVALHHATDPANPLRPKYNQAIPIRLIHAVLKAAGRVQ